MTPKEKAIELVDKMFIEMSNFSITDEVLEEVAKQCALIAVNEIMKQCWDYRDIDLQASYDNWQEVKQEIINL
jgi:hypothetical protein